jgi:hypothetical protein
MESTGRVKAVRRDIARIKTIMGQPVAVAAVPAPVKAKPAAKKAAAPSKVKRK